MEPPRSPLTSAFNRIKMYVFLMSRLHVLLWQRNSFPCTRHSMSLTVVGSQLPHRSFASGQQSGKKEYEGCCQKIQQSTLIWKRHTAVPPHSQSPVYSSMAPLRSEGLGVRPAVNHLCQFPLYLIKWPFNLENSNTNNGYLALTNQPVVTQT